MITRRLETAPPPAPPVRFYKFIAVSFLLLTIVLLGVVIFITTKRAEITIIAKADRQRVSLSAVIGSPARGGLAGTVSSTPFFYRGTFYPSGTKSVAGIATGEITIFNTSDAGQPLVKTTRLLSPEGVLFRLAAGVSVPAGGSVKANVYADKPGASYDIGPARFTIPGLNPAKQKQIYAESGASMRGGAARVGAVTTEDIAAAQAQYAKQVIEAFRAAASSTIPPGATLVVGLVESRAVPSVSAGAEVAEFTVAGNNTMVLAAFPATELSALRERERARVIDPGAEQIISAVGTPELTLGRYNAAAGTAELTVAETLLVTLDSNLDKLAPYRFVSKTKEEIERMLLSLDHVENAAVRFSPGWMRRAPALPGKIKVVVKTVE
ncbi:MAG: hypothetical protein HYV42_03745 [Candidatus Magasanikbacteria bacterium]|nr:hypothetical protein [Candidatus Magasanikbacteria bacterium]